MADKTSNSEDDAESSSKPAFVVEPSSPTLVNADIDISLTGLVVGEPVCVVARVREQGKVYVSYGNYAADADGAVRLKTMESTSGTYRGRCDRGEDIDVRYISRS